MDGRFDLIHLFILLHPQPSHEISTATLNPVPHLILVFLLYVPLPANLQNAAVFNFHLQIHLLHPLHVSFEQVSFWCFTLIDLCVHECQIFSRKCRETSWKWNLWVDPIYQEKEDRKCLFFDHQINLEWSTFWFWKIFEVGNLLTDRCYDCK